jgi:DNA helicase-2/ATP-dependent DNA helicase PcrA
VGITRARKRAIISHAANRRIYANWQSSIPSRFIEELPEEFLSRTGSAAVNQAGRMAAPVFPIVARRVREADAWENAGRPARVEKIPVGARVFHEKFGAGRVIAVDDDRLDICFDHAGEKRVLDRFVERRDG